MKLQKRVNQKTGEELYTGKHSSGLEVCIMPRKGYSKSYAIFGTRYGSVDSKFVVPGEEQVTEVPDGIAHYLEHKMFDQPDGSNVFEQFSKYGANANAFTSFNVTAYLFSATSHLEENLKILMDYVQSPAFTPESVQKEQGIIGQEIGMYDDDGNWRVFFNFLDCLYQEHPVKLDIAGTVESISHITDDLLYKCYNTFYNLSNMTIFVTGDLDVEKIAEVISQNVKKNEPFDEEIKKIYPEEPKQIAKPYKEQKLSVSIPLFMMGFKDTDTGYDGDALLKKNIEMEILLKMIFGKSSSFYQELYEQGLINSGFSMEYSMQPDYAYSSASGESKDPQKVYERMLAEVRRVQKEGLDPDDFQRVKKVIWGDYIRSYNDVEDYAHAFLTLWFMGIDYFDYYKVYETVTFRDVQKRFEKHFSPENAALSIVWPVE